MFETHYDELYTPDGLGRRGEVMPALVAACPRFVTWSDRDELMRGTGPLSDAALFGEYLDEEWRGGNQEVVRAGLHAVEELLLTGDQDIEEVIRNGLLESLGVETFEKVRRFCGPATLVQWAILGTIGPIAQG